MGSTPLGAEICDYLVAGNVIGLFKTGDRSNYLLRLRRNFASLKLSHILITKIGHKLTEGDRVERLFADRGPSSKGQGKGKGKANGPATPESPGPPRHPSSHIGLFLFRPIVDYVVVVLFTSFLTCFHMLFPGLLFLFSFCATQ